MKMVMIIIDEAKRDELEVFLDRVGVIGYTELSHAAGMGTTGPRLGSRAFPRTSAVVFSVISAEDLDRLRLGIDQFCAQCGEDLKMIAWDVDEVR